MGQPQSGLAPFHWHSTAWHGTAHFQSVVTGSIISTTDQAVNSEQNKTEQLGARHKWVGEAEKHSNQSTTIKKKLDRAPAVSIKR